MSNFTPINTNRINKSSFKKKFNFLLFGNLIMIVLIGAVGLIYYNKTLQTTKQKAATRKPFGCFGGEVDYYLKKDENCVWVRDGAKKNFQFGEYFFCEKDGASGCPRSGVPAQESYVFKPPTFRACFKKDCGTEQIDFQFDTGAQCYYSRIDDDCSPPPPDSPTPTNTPTLTPTTTSTLTLILTPTSTPTLIPTKTSTPTPTETPTSTPTPTPTNTPGPTSTLVPVPCGTKDCDDKTNPCSSGYICVQAKDGSNYCTSPDFVDACKANPSFQSCCTAPGFSSPTPTEIILVRSTNIPIQSSPTSTPPQQIVQTGDLRSSWIFAVPIGIILLGLLL